MSARREDVAKEFTAKGRATRSRIVAEATEIVYENGVANTRLQDVQQAAGVSGSQMYHYFPDKTLLVHAVVDRWRDPPRPPGTVARPPRQFGRDPGVV